MDMQEFRRGVREGRRRVQLPVAEDGGPAERGFLANPLEHLRDPQGGIEGDPMMIVIVDREFVAPRFDDGRRELSVSQIVGFLESPEYREDEVGEDLCGDPWTGV